MDNNTSPLKKGTVEKDKEGYLSGDSSSSDSDGKEMTQNENIKGKEKEVEWSCAHSVSRFEVRIVSSTNRLDASFSQFAVYNIDIRFGGRKWRVSRRFSQFVELHQQLKEAFPKRELPSLPPKHTLRSSTNKQLVKERMDELNKYLQALAQRGDLATSRQFIQWLSHDQDPSFIPPVNASAVHTGWLMKQGHVRKNWKLRWFVLKSRFLFYFKNKQAFQPLGAIPLRSCVVEMSKLKDCCIKLEPDPKCQPFYIRANNEEEIGVWFKKLRKVSSVYTQRKKRNVPLSAILSVSPMTPEFRRKAFQHNPRASCVVGEPRSGSRLSNPTFPSRPKSASPRSPPKTPKAPPNSPPRSPSQSLSESKSAFSRLSPLPSRFKSPPKSPKSTSKLSPKFGSMTFSGRTSPTSISSFSSSASSSVTAYSPSPSSPYCSLKDTEGCPVSKPRRSGSFSPPTGKRPGASDDLLSNAYRPYTPRKSYSMAPGILSEEVMEKMLQAKEHVDKELASFQLKVSELLKEDVLSRSDQAIMEQVRDLVDEMCQMSLIDLLKEDQCEKMIKQLQTDIVKLSECREFPTMMLLLLSPLSRLLYTYKTAKDAKTMHEVEEIASIGCRGEFPDSPQRLSATEDPLRNHLTSLGSSLSGSYSPKASPNILHSRATQSMKDLPPKEPVPLELQSVGVQKEFSKSVKEGFSSSCFVEKFSSSSATKIENEDFSFLPRVHTDSKRPFLSTCVMLVSAFCAGGAGILVEETNKGELVSSIADFSLLDIEPEDDNDPILFGGDSPKEGSHKALNDSFDEKMAIVNGTPLRSEETPAELIQRFSAKSSMREGEEDEVKETEGGEEKEGKEGGDGEALCRVCDRQFCKKMVDKHAEYCSKVRGFERKFKISSEEMWEQLGGAVNDRLSELDALPDQPTDENAVRQRKIFEQMSEAISGLMLLEKGSASQTRRSLGRVEDSIKMVKAGMAFNKNECESQDAAIGPFGSLLLRILMDQRASLKEETKKSHLFGLDKYWRKSGEGERLVGSMGGSLGEGDDLLEETSKVTIHDFEMVKPISSGAFGKVWLARKTKSGDLYAVKIIRKSDVIRKNMQEHVSNERNVMELAANNPFLVDFYYAFQSNDHVYLVMEFIQGGDCGSLLENVGYLEEGMARLYIAEVVLALEYLHSMNIVHRDLKPDNMLVTVDGHIKLTDFGLSFVGAEVLGIHEGNRVVGTPDYIAPEALMGTGYGPSVDWWALGIVLFELLVGFPPFNDESPTHIFQNILKKEICWPLPPEELSPEAKDLIEQLLTTERTERLGANGAGEVKKHPFFAGLDWDNLLGTKLQFQPQVDNELDTGYFVPHSSLSMSLVGNFQKSDQSGEMSEGEKEEGSGEEEVGISKFNLPNFSYVNFDGLADLTKEKSGKK